MIVLQLPGALARLCASVRTVDPVGIAAQEAIASPRLSGPVRRVVLADELEWMWGLCVGALSTPTTAEEAEMLTGGRVDELRGWVATTRNMLDHYVNHHAFRAVAMRSEADWIFTGWWYRGKPYPTLSALARGARSHATAVCLPVTLLPHPIRLGGRGGTLWRPHVDYDGYWEGDRSAIGRLRWLAHAMHERTRRVHHA